MKKIPFYFILIIGSILAFASCEDDFNPTGEYYTAWTPHPEVKYDYTALTNAHVTEDRLYLAGDNYFLTFDEEHNLINKFLFSESAGNKGWFKRPTITDKIFGYRLYETTNSNTFTRRVEGRLQIHINENPSKTTVIDLNEVDTAQWYINSNKVNDFIVTKDNQLLIPAFSGSGATIKVAIFIFDIVIGQTIEYAFNRKIFMPAGATYLPQNEGFVEQGDYIYFSSMRALYQIDISNNNALRVGENRFSFLYDVKISSDTTYLIASQGYTTIFSYTTKSGENGGIQIGFDNLYGDWQFVNIGGELIGYYYQAIGQFSLDFQKNYIDIKNLQDEDLEGGIYKMIAFKDRVYCATINGLFFKKIDNFFQEEK
jgi:hypothetical protein